MSWSGGNDKSVLQDLEWDPIGILFVILMRVLFFLQSSQGIGSEHWVLTDFNLIFVLFVWTEQSLFEVYEGTVTGFVSGDDSWQNSFEVYCCKCKSDSLSIEVLAISCSTISLFLFSSCLFFWCFTFFHWLWVAKYCLNSAFSKCSLVSCSH